VTALDVELQRLMDVDQAVRSYLSHLWAFEQGAEDDEGLLDYWRGELERLTDDR
jgi:hypothetical protein